MKVGIKFWSRNPARYLNEAGFADFIEVLPVDLKSMKKFTAKDYPYTIHVPHEGFGFNPLTSYHLSKKLLDRAIKAARMVNASTLIMHNVHLKEEPDAGTARAAVKATAKLIRESNFNGIVVENSGLSTLFRGKPDRNYFGHTVQHLRAIMEESGAGFCLDFEHAAISASVAGLDFEKYTRQLMRLKPEYLQFSGARLKTSERHLSILDGDIDKELVRKMIRELGRPVCLETPIDTSQRKNEVEFLKQ